MYTFNADAPVSEEECVFIMKLLGDLIHEAEQMERIIVAKEDEYTERRNRAVGKMEKLRAQKGWKNNPKIMQEIRELEREKNITSLPIDGSPIKNHIRAALNAFHHMYDQYDMSDKINEL
jgi:glutathionylspermidine synthase